MITKCAKKVFMENLETVNAFSANVCLSQKKQWVCICVDIQVLQSPKGLAKFVTLNLKELTPFTVTTEHFM